MREARILFQKLLLSFVESFFRSGATIDFGPVFSKMLNRMNTKSFTVRQMSVSNPV